MHDNHDLYDGNKIIILYNYARSEEQCMKNILKEEIELSDHMY